ncbi:hypothetical protein AB0C12_42430 [Actinoplanes sp. NPDC048967]|uniref:hypothetical protein n=1 Tax=Actinoplanes sp. NPDC048967 TaxID=3155269 RepID=UPI0033DAF2A8
MVTMAVLIRGTRPAGESVHRSAEFGSCREAERMAGRLSGAGFPVERVGIVGTGLRAEPATARPDKTGTDRTGRHQARAVLLGAGLGAWLGLLTGLVLGLFIAGPAWPGVLLGGLLIGAFLGGLVGLLTHWAVDQRTGQAGPSVIRGSDPPSRSTRPARPRLCGCPTGRSHRDARSAGPTAVVDTAGSETTC